MQTYVKRWLPSLIVMAIIFAFSSRPANELPYFDWADQLVKKSGHTIGYALLAVSYWHALAGYQRRGWIAWILAILYAITDEIHQTIVPGRHPSAWDVLIFDNLGASIGLTLAHFYSRKANKLLIGD